jgi:hypothetical protein
MASSEHCNKGLSLPPRIKLVSARDQITTKRCYAAELRRCIVRNLHDPLLAELKESPDVHSILHPPYSLMLKPIAE